MDSKNIRHTFETFFFSNPVKRHCVKLRDFDPKMSAKNVLGNQFFFLRNVPISMRGKKSKISLIKVGG